MNMTCVHINAHVCFWQLDFDNISILIFVEKHADLELGIGIVDIVVEEYCLSSSECEKHFGSDETIGT